MRRGQSGCLLRFHRLFGRWSRLRKHAGQRNPRSIDDGHRDIFTLAPPTEVREQLVALSRSSLRINGEASKYASKRLYYVYKAGFR